MQHGAVVSFLILLLVNYHGIVSNAFSSTTATLRLRSKTVTLLMSKDSSDSDLHDSMMQLKFQSHPSSHHASRTHTTSSSSSSTRKSFLHSIVASTILTNGISKDAFAQEEGFESIAARAAQMAKVAEQMEETDKDSASKSTQRTNTNTQLTTDARTMYDFSLPVAGTDVPLFDLIKQEFYDEQVKNGPDEEVGTSSSSSSSPSSSTMKRDARVKAILVVNIKQDDPVARKNIPELISLAAKFGRSGDFAVICSPTDQGYFEADTSTLIRLKLASEYGYGINPSTIVTDKVNILGTGAHPFWRWIEGSCRAPSGLGRIQGNFEKFLVDGRTGKPLRRYPRQYQPFDIAEDIDAIIQGKPLPPAGANWREEWRSSDKDAEKDVYRFQKGLNFYDQ